MVSRVVSRRTVFVAAVLATAVSFYTLGIIHARHSDAIVERAYDAKIDAIRTEVRTELGRSRRTDAVVPAGTSGQTTRAKDETDVMPAKSARDRMVAEIKQELQSEMGLLPVHLLRDRRSSFVELYSTDNFGKTNYGTAGYLGHGYFITVKHAVVALSDDADRPNTRKIGAIKIMYGGKELPARLIDTGDAVVEVHPGDWAIIKTKEVDLPALVRVRRPDLPPRQRLLEGHHPLNRVRRSAHGERARDLPHGRPSRRLGRRRAESARQSGRDSDWPDAGRLPLLVHPPDPCGNAPEGAGL